MSFIFGIFDLTLKDVELEEFRALADSFNHDFEEQTYINGPVALGFCHHPERRPKAGIFKEDDIFVLADIRIYNTEELASNLAFTTPHEAFAKAYRLWGEECVQRINGDYAVVVVDLRKNKALLFRDHIGARSLTYCISDTKLIFASHEFGLAKSHLFKPVVSEKKIISELFKNRRNYQQTIFSQIRKVMPGHIVTYSENNEKIQKYWKPENIKRNNNISFEAAVIRLKELIVSATLRRMEAGKIGLHVSGGLDSCSLASIVADHTQQKDQLFGYSWSPEVFENEVEGINEKAYIEKFSADKGLLVRYVNLEKNEYIKNFIIPEFETQQIEHPVMKLAGRDGVETIFSGWGGDECVSLSTRGTVNHLFFRMKWMSLCKYLKKIGVRGFLHQFRTDVLPLLCPFGLIPVYNGTDYSNLRLLQFSFILRNWKQLFFNNQKNIFGFGNRTQFMINLLELGHLAERMDSWAINAEQYGFDYKYPLLDKDVLEFWLSIPVEFTYQDFESRLLFRESMKNILTDEIRIRKDKSERLRVAHSKKETMDGKAYLESLFDSFSQEYYPYFFRFKTLQKNFKEPLTKDPQKNLGNINKLAIYLRYIHLIKKYIRT